MRYFILFVSSLVLLSSPVLAEKVTLRLWHSYAADGFYKELAQDFTKQYPDIKIITTNYPTDDLKSTLIFSMLKNDAPDMVLFPSDLLGYYKVLKLGEVPMSWFSRTTELASIQTTGEDKKHYGIPLYQGNHLMLYYNKRLVDKPAITWQEMANQLPQLAANDVKPLAMRLNKMYWFISFLNAYDGFSIQKNKIAINEESMKKALVAYKFLLDQNLTEIDCDFECTNERFFRGDFAYSFNGVWSYRESKKRLGDDLGITALPSINGLALKSMRSTIVLAFPNNSLHSEKSQAIFNFSNYLQSKAVQRDFYNINGLIPVDRNLLEAIQHEGSKEQKTVMNLLENTVEMPTSSAMSAIWPGMSLGVELFLAEDLTAEQAVIFIQNKLEQEIRKIKQLERAAH